LSEVKRGAEHAAQLTAQLLAYGRRQILQPKELDLGRYLTDTGEMLRRLIRDDIELSLVVSHDLDRVFVDPTQLKQILMNLCLNARDAIEGPGRITIEAQNSSVSENANRDAAGYAPGRYVCLSVTDDGSGMSEDIRLRVCDPFFTTKPQGKGTGLGLSVVQGIVHQHGGYMELESQPGTGTRVGIHIKSTRLPVANAPSEASFGARGGVQDHSGCRGRGGCAEVDSDDSRAVRVQGAGGL